MTRGKFIVASCFKKLGINFRQQRISASTKELQLLKEAEILLGRMVWHQLDGIKGYRTLHDQVNEMINERNYHNAKIREIESTVEDIKKGQTEQFREINKPDSNLEEAFEKQSQVVKKIMSMQQDVNNLSINVKERYRKAVQNIKSGMLDLHQIEAEKKKIAGLKKQFTSIKQKKILFDRIYVKELSILESAKNTLETAQRSYKYNAVNYSEFMRNANHAISTHRGEIAAIDADIISFYNDIGIRISKDCFTRTDCKNAVSNRMKMCNLIKKLRNSIDYNLNLADRPPLIQ